MSIRLRLAFWYGGFLVATVAALSLGLFFLLADHLYVEVDSSLRSRAASIRQSGSFAGLRPESDTTLTLPPSVFGEPDVYVQITDPSATPVVTSVNLQRQTLPVTGKTRQALETGHEFVETVALDSARLRMLSSPVVGPDGQVVWVIQSASSLQLTDSTLARFRNLLLGASLGVVVIAAVSGLYLTRKSLDPIAAITRTAEAIYRRGDLSRRIDAGSGTDELSTLGRTINRMLDHIEQSVNAQKRFIGDASHELKTPLTVVRGNAELISRHPAGSHTEDTAAAILREADRMQRIVDDLLAVAELDSNPELEFESVDVRRVARRVMQDLETVADGRTLDVTGSGDAWVKADVDKLERALRNLVQNAIAATPEDGRVRVDVQVSTGAVDLRIIDNGFGIKPEDRPHVFERFFRVDKARSRHRGGTGLGLTIVKGVVEAHDGTIVVGTSEWGGAEFVVRLPTTAHQPVEIDPAPAHVT